MGSERISVDTEQVLRLAEVVRGAETEARRLLGAPQLLRAGMAAMSPLPGGLAEAAGGFLDAWRQALEDAADELDLLSGALELAAQLYGATQQVTADRHGITMLGGIR